MMERLNMNGHRNILNTPRHPRQCFDPTLKTQRTTTQRGYCPLRKKRQSSVRIHSDEITELREGSPHARRISWLNSETPDLAQDREFLQFTLEHQRKNARSWPDATLDFKAKKTIPPAYMVGH
jgi:hypothetical protein